MTRLKLIIIIALTSTLILNGQSKDSPIYKTLDPYYFHLQFLNDSNSILIDVREFFEFRRSRIRDAVHLPSSKDLLTVADTISKETSIFLYCATDYRAIRAAEILYENGFRKIYVLDGGISFWKKEGMPVESKRLRRKDTK
jgi:rhodanese-related sulfurtransferase